MIMFYLFLSLSIEGESDLNLLIQEISKLRASIVELSAIIEAQKPAFRRNENETICERQYVTIPKPSVNGTTGGVGSLNFTRPHRNGHRSLIESQNPRAPCVRIDADEITGLYEKKEKGHVLSPMLRPYLLSYANRGVRDRQEISLHVPRRSPKYHKIFFVRENLGLYFPAKRNPLRFKRI